MILPAAAVLFGMLVANPTSQYLDGAELQCENPVQVASALLFILENDQAYVEEHLFPDYRGKPVWDVQTFFARYFVPASEGLHPGETVDLFQPETRALLKRFLVEISTDTTTVPVPIWRLSEQKTAFRGWKAVVLNPRRFGETGDGRA